MSDPSETTIKADAVKVVAPSVEVTSDAPVIVREKVLVVNPLIQYAVITTSLLAIVIAMLIGMFLSPQYIGVIITTCVTGISVLAGILKIVGDYRHEANHKFDALLALTGKSKKAEGVLEERDRQEKKGSGEPKEP